MFLLNIRRPGHECFQVFVGWGLAKVWKLNQNMLKIGKRVWKQYETLYVDGEDFNEIGAAFENTGSVRKASLGNGTIALMKQRELVNFAVTWIEQNRK